MDSSTKKMLQRAGALAAGAVLMAGLAAMAQSVPVVTGDARVDKLLSQMTLEEKLTLIHGTQEDPKVYQGQAGYLAGIPRLKIPSLRFADGPPGVLTRVPSQGETATMGVAATFSVKDAEDNGLVIGREDRALGIDVSLQPFVNIDRDLEFGRGYNTFGEDPYLTSVMGVAEVKGIQSQHVMAQIKHYVGYDSDNENTYIDDQTLHEVYVAPFDAAVKADVSSIMCSYNKLNDVFACGNKDTMTGILRDELGFKGFVTSDWGAVHSVDFIKAGLDMEMPGEPDPNNHGFSIPSFFDSRPVPPPPAPGAMGDIGDMFGGHIPEEPKPAGFGGGNWGVKLDPKKMPEALKDGTVTEADVTRAAGRVLYEIVHFGYMDGLHKHEVTPQAIEANAKIIEKTGEDAAVLLKNEGNVLPLKSNDLESVVLIGPTAAQVDSIGINGERSVGLPQRQVGPLAAMRKISGNADIQFAVADDMTGTTIPANLLSHDGKPGLARSGGGAEKVDPQLNFTTKAGNALPPNSTVTWKGTLNVPKDGEYWIYLQAMGTNASLKLDGKKFAATGAFQGGVHGDILQANQDNVVPTTDNLDNVRRSIELKAGEHAIEISTSSDTSNAPVQVRLNWYTPEQRQSDHDAAIAAAKNAKTAVVFAWTRLSPVFGLPGDQNKLIEEIAAVNPNTVVVLNTSQPVALPWVDKVKGVLEMWWPGDEGGWATANILLGKTSPAGRLPVTWGKRLEDYAATDPKHPERSKRAPDKKTIYSEGVNVGYRWFDKENIEPLFAFGHGLSYTTFEYSDLKVGKLQDGGLDVTVKIKNTGSVASDEVPQVYIGAPSQIPEGVQFATRALAAFDRVHIGTGQTKTVTMHVPERQLQYWSIKNKKWVTVTAKRTVSVGGSSRNLPLKQEIN
ncbi:beta-glucosidase [Occallatibacter riparius]|uniref:Glycoside hydrolase family 3 C-terminal domain-containing protein n=1 Tax=Occallatibacter riparius TaxID=1002689 RepID=A0A9J7BKM7_9BACT|nr:glycoside hydrolase family 3 C-terminal domain-containing protein [Occallatibacter riparius]UWZ83384.1 glycoside hydrolase family 3 C-terminal domain-containing protein [Occallatibacter riparius]